MFVVLKVPSNQETAIIYVMANSICYSLYLLMYCLYTIKYCTRCIGGNVLTWFYLIVWISQTVLTGFSIFNISIMAVVNIHARYNYCNTLHSRGNTGNRNRIRYIWRTYQIHPTLLYVEYKAPMINNLLVVVVRGSVARQHSQTLSSW